MNEAPWVIFLAVMLILAAVKFIGWLLKAKPKRQVIAPPIPTPKPGLDIESMSNGSVQVLASGKKTIIRLSGGSKFRGTINGKRIEVDVPSYKAWEEIVIES